MIPNALRHLEARLRELDGAGLLRSPRSLDPGCLVLSSNDYLGYARRPTELASGPLGAGSSRLVSGDTDSHARAERALASWVGAPSALLFSSGYAANIGVLSALVGSEDVVISDALNHASIIDGCRLSRARIVIVPHLDVSAIEAALRGSGSPARRWVVTESYFSMDADTPDLPNLRRLCNAYDAGLIVDEAHALGVFGPRGAGLCARTSVVPDALVGTLGKAVGLQGAFVAGSEALRAWLWNRARSFVFSTAVSPAFADAVADRVREVQEDAAGRSKLSSVADRFRQALAEHGARTVGYGPIIPWILGEADAALNASKRLLEGRVFVPAIRPPTVSPGTSRLRLTSSAALTIDEVEQAAGTLRKVAFDVAQGIVSRGT